MVNLFSYYRIATYSFKGVFKVEEYSYKTTKINKPQFFQFTIEFFFEAAIFVSLFIKSYYFQFTSKLNIRPFLNPINNMMMLSSFGMILIIISLFLIVFNRKRHLALLLLNIFLSFVLFSDTVYFRYYYSVLSISSFYQLGLVGSISDSIFSLLKYKDIIYFIDLPLIILGIFLWEKYNNKDIKPLHLSKRSLIALICVLVGYFSINTTLKNTDISTFKFDNNYIIKNAGIAYYHYYDIKSFIKNNYLTDRKLTDEEKADLEKFYNDKPKEGEKYRGIAKGKNLLILQVEALQHFVINAKTPSGEEITPNLNKLIKESQYFDNIYYQIGGGNTADAELLTNTSLYPSKEGCAYFLYPTNYYYSIGNILKAQGYNTYASHANNPTFWNRSVMYNALGFQEFYSNKKFELDEYIGWGLGDASFYKQTLEKMNLEEPFYSFMLSLSSHFPFKYPYFENYDFNVGKYEGTFIGYYLKSINYADKAIGKLIEELKKQGVYENTLLVIYGDHMAVPKDESEGLMDFVNKEYSDFEWLKLQKVPLIIHNPEFKGANVVNITGGQIDILPTIANLMDFDVPYALGKDLFNCYEGYAVLRNSTVITDEFIYLASNGKTYDIEQGSAIEEKLYAEKIKKLQHQLYVSDIILKKNALKK